jgi:quinol monooxygenase YgiN
MSMSEQIVTIARWQTRSDKLGDVLRLIAELRLRSLGEPGCLGYEVFEHLDDHSALLLIERYRDSEALQSHRLSAHYRELVVDRILPLLESRHVELLGLRE